jgi:hypothetical protein
MDVPSHGEPLLEKDISHLFFLLDPSSNHVGLFFLPWKRMVVLSIRMVELLFS